MPALRIVLLTAFLLTPLAVSRANIDLAPPPSTSPFELVVVEAEGCIYCQVFRRDVLSACKESEQAKGLPVRFVDVNDIAADHLSFNSDVDMVPTFVVVKSHAEVGRISGYMGREEFFHSIRYLLDSAP